MTDEERWNEKFGEFISYDSIPKECIDELSSPGPHDADAGRWCDRLEFDIGFPTDLGRKYMVATGGWPRWVAKTTSDRDVAKIILWLACCQLSEDESENPGEGVFNLGDFNYIDLKEEE